MSEQKRCEHCRHWLRPVDRAKPGLCLRLSGPSLHGKAVATIHPKAKRGQHAELRTFPDFGCIHFEARTPGT